MIKRKIKHIVLIVLILFTSCSMSYGVRIKRICVKGDDVILMYYNVSDTCSKFISFIIYARENVFDVFKPIDSIKNPDVNDYIHLNAKIKSTKWEYFIELIRNCSGNDTIYSDTMAIDLKEPNNIEIDSVSVKNGKTEIGWKASKSPDTKGYIIYYTDITGHIGIIDTVYGKNNTFYKDLKTGNPDKKIEKYNIAAFDSCDNVTIISKPHNTILLTTDQDTCKEEVSLNWNKYDIQLWPDNQTDYYIYYSKNGSSFSAQYKMPNNNVNYTFKVLEDNSQYCFFVRANNRDSNFSSTSSISCITTNFIQKPAYLYLKNVTVLNDQLEISWAIDRDCQINEFRVYRKDLIQTYSLLQTIPYDNSKTDYLIIDKTAVINSSIYTYYVEETDVCKNPSIKSNEASNILLLNEQNETAYQLKWNIYSGWAGGVNNQTLFSKKEEDMSWSNLNNPTITENVYGKNLLMSDLKGEEICFYIENFEGDTNKYGYKETSTSNISCISGPPSIYIPNALHPKGINNVFKPIGKNIDSTRTEIKIYNRWGQMIWSSRGITEGWKGRDANNNELPEGVYYYFIIVFGNDLSKTELKGDVTLLK